MVSSNKVNRATDSRYTSFGWNGRKSPTKRSWISGCSQKHEARKDTSKSNRTRAASDGESKQPALDRAIAWLFETRGAPDFVEVAPPDHGRIETRRIWCGPAFDAYFDFPHAGRVFMIEREFIGKKSGAQRREIALGIMSRSPQEASPKRVLAVNLGHGSIESVH